MLKCTGLVDSFATYVPTAPLRDDDQMPDVPSYDPSSEGSEWCLVDDPVHDGPRLHRFSWNPSVTVKDDVVSGTEDEAIDALLKRHTYEWPDHVGDWKLHSVDHQCFIESSEIEAIAA